jgi:hypothetical protein
LIEDFIVDDPDVKVEREIGYFKLKWTPNSIIPRKTATIKVKLVS